ncbi:MAG: ATP-binding protein [Bacteroidota bacterium]
MIKRTIQDKIQSKIGRGKAIMVIGPRQVGKTTLISQFLKNKDFKFFDGDDPLVRQPLNTPNTEEIRSLLGNKKIVFIDEAQRINNIGLTMKIIVDQFKDVQLWISGSSSFSLFNELNEPLTGRKWEYELYPISWEEYENDIGYLQSEMQLKNRLRFGMYPDVLNNPGEETEVLRTLVESYLYKDVLAFSRINKPDVLQKLIRALALQVGSEVNYNELSRPVGIDKNTIEKYISVLEQGYVIFRLPSFSRNMRNEIKRGKKIYFYDNGIRNMVIKSMNEIEFRNDIGALWENFLVSERIKQNKYKLTLASSYFWRTVQQQEIDYVEEVNMKIKAYKFKWNPKRKVKLSKSFIEQYDAESHVISRDNFRTFVKI